MIDFDESPVAAVVWEGSRRLGIIWKHCVPEKTKFSSDGTCTTKQLETILAKMKELQGDKSRLDYLQADLAEVTKLYESAVASNDPFGKAQLDQRITLIKTEIEELQGEKV